jgi:PRC-barrel domain protein
VTTDDEHQIGYQALPRGVPVQTSDGAVVGTVYRVLDNAREHIFDGIVVDTGSGRRVFVDAPEVARITGSRVTLTIDAAEAAQLPAHSGTMGSVHTRATRTGHRWRRWFGR